MQCKREIYELDSDAITFLRAVTSSFSPMDGLAFEKRITIAES